MWFLQHSKELQPEDTLSMLPIPNFECNYHDRPKTLHGAQFKNFGFALLLRT